MNRPVTTGPRINAQITAKEVRLINADGDMVGIVNTREALMMAADASLDLVEISPNTEPPVAKILNYGKYKYELNKKQNEAKKKQKIIEIKEIKLNPTIDDNDFNIKMKNATRFLEEGNKIKISIRFRGREMNHKEIGFKIIDKVKEALPIAKIEQDAKLEGRSLGMMIAPK